MGSVQGIPAVIAPILSTSLYQVDKDLPFAVVAGVVLLMAITLLSTKNKSVGSQLASEPMDSTK
ncbi:hypothetical protein Elgi_42820 [Paenibacillus elgii]|nr:hypothetical protein Elgi_42820 [Paenibacillus elgii]